MLIHHPATTDVQRLGNYFRRLGCTVRPHTPSSLHVEISYPETVTGETEALHEWCATWSRQHSHTLTTADRMPRASGRTRWLERLVRLSRSGPPTGFPRARFSLDATGSAPIRPRRS